MSLLSLLGFGFLLGMRHATDPDHVVAVSTIVARHKSLGTAWLLGAFWGLGHTATIFLAGAVIILFKVSIPARLELALELGVGLVLVLLGLLNMAGHSLGSLGLKAHSHPHDHADPEHRHQLLEAPDGKSHSHAHVHALEPGWLKRHARRAGSWQLLRSAGVGLVHGLAGSAAVALLALAAIPGPGTGLLYLFLFGLGTLAGMLILSAMMELCMLALLRWWRTAERLLVFGTGLLSFILGLLIVYQQGFAKGLLWRP